MDTSQNREQIKKLQHQCWWCHKLKMWDRKSMLFLFCLQVYLDKHEIHSYQILSGHQRLDNLNYLGLMKINSILHMDTYYILKRNWNWCCCQATCLPMKNMHFLLFYSIHWRKKIRRKGGRRMLEFSFTELLFCSKVSEDLFSIL